MKFAFVCAVIAFCSSSLPAVETAVKPKADSPPVIIEKGANHRVWQMTSEEPAPGGKTRTVIKTYTELGGGMHVFRDGQWIESKEEIEIIPGGAIARQGPLIVNFLPNLNTKGAVDMQDQDGKHYKSQIIGLAYYDHASHNSQLLATLKDAQGELQPPNVIVYVDAFSGLKADVKYVY